MASNDETRRAVEEARQLARIEGHLNQHDRQLDAITAQVGTNTGELRSLGRSIDRLRADFEASIAVAKARAEDAELAAKRQVTGRQLYLAAAGVVISLTSVLAAGGVFH